MVEKLFIVMFLIMPIGVDAETVNAEIDSHSVPSRVNFSVPTDTHSAFPFSGSEIAMSDGQRIRYYSSDVSMQEKPLVIFLPGSGCNGAFSVLPGGGTLWGQKGLL